LFPQAAVFARQWLIDSFWFFNVIIEENDSWLALHVLGCNEFYLFLLLIFCLVIAFLALFILF